MKKALLLVLLVGCDHATTSAPAADAAATAPSVSSTAQTAQASSPAPKANPVEAELLTLTKAWNDALAKRDAEALRPVYGANVKLYQNAMTRDAAIKAKAGALASAKDYTQSLQQIEINGVKSARPTAVFEKRWTQNGKNLGVRASLAFAKEGGKWVVVEESDAPSDARKARAANKESCEGLVIGVVSSIPEVAKFLAGPTDPAHGHSSNGLRIGSGPPESPTFSVGMHENHDDRLVTMGWYDVDPKSGKVTNELSDVAPSPDPKIVDKMKAACAKP